MEEKACNLGGHLTTLTATSLILWQMLQKAEMERNRVPTDLSGLLKQTTSETGFAFSFSSYVRQQSLLII